MATVVVMVFEFHNIQANR